MAGSGSAWAAPVSPAAMRIEVEIRTCMRLRRSCTPSWLPVIAAHGIQLAKGGRAGYVRGLPVSPRYQPAPRLPDAVGPAIYDVVAPARFPRLDLRFRNQRWAA